MILTSIAAMGTNRALGKDNQLLWHLPADLKHFKELTKGHTIIMGRKTWESLGGKPLPHRTHIVITRQLNYQAEGALVVSSLEAALELARHDDQPFVVGGAEIYAQAMAHVDRIELTVVHLAPEADAYFPAIPTPPFRLVESNHRPADEANPAHMEFQRWERVL
jgi:dihydrofolate reductase